MKADPPWGKVRIGAVDWEVRPDENAQHHGVFATNRHVERLLLIDPRLDHWTGRVASLHETLHAIECDFLDGDDQLTESQVKTLAMTLAGVFRDNPEYAAWLTSPPVGEKHAGD